MSSFKAKVAQMEKKKATKAHQPREGEDASLTTSPPVPQEGIEHVFTDTSTEYTQAFYGEDQEEAQEQPKWERMIPLDRIRPNPFQPRKTFDAAKLAELAEGMKEHGWVGGGLPVRVHASEPNTYELVWGERRWRAARIAGLKTIPCVVSVYSDEDLIEKGLLENIQREDLSNLEEGQAYVHLLALSNEHHKPRYSIRRLAKRLGKDKSYIEDRLQYARVPIDVQQLAVDQPDISSRIIRELGELSKMLTREEREPVVEGVREGKLRIEDIREIRKDVEQQRKQETTVVTAPSHNPPIARPVKRTPEVARLPPTTQVSVATDTSLPSSPVEEKPSEEVGQVSWMPQARIPSPEPVRPASMPPTPMTTAMIVSVFEKTLKRENEVLERIFGRLTSTCGTLTEDERNILRRYVQRWNTTLQDLMSTIEQSLAEEEGEE